MSKTTLSQWYTRADRALELGDAVRPELRKTRGCENFLRGIPREARPFYFKPDAVLAQFGIHPTDEYPTGFRRQYSDEPALLEESHIAFAPVFIAKERGERMVCVPDQYYVDPRVNFVFVPILKFGEKGYDITGTKRGENAGLVYNPGPREDEIEHGIDPVLVWLHARTESRFGFRGEVANVRFMMNRPAPEDAQTPMPILTQWMAGKQWLEGKGA